MKKKKYFSLNGKRRILLPVTTSQGLHVSGFEFVVMMVMMMMMIVIIICQFVSWIFYFEGGTEGGIEYI